MADLHPLSAWAERRPERTEHDRTVIAETMAAHLPKPPPMGFISEADLGAMKAAFIRRFDEDLPRTETLMAVAMIGYRMALRDSDASFAQDRNGLGPEGVAARASEGGIAQPSRSREP